MGSASLGEGFERSVGCTEVPDHTAGCPTHLVQTRGAPKPTTPVPRPSPASSVSKGEGMGGVVPKSSDMEVVPKSSDVGTAAGCRRGGDIPAEVWTRWGR